MSEENVAAEAALFHVDGYRTDSATGHFVLRGRVLSGRIRPGGVVEIPLNSALNAVAEIERIADAGEADKVDLYIAGADPDWTELLTAFDVSGEDLRVSFGESA